MPPPTARQRDSLEAFAAALRGEGFEARLVEQTAAIPVDTVLVLIGESASGMWQLELSYVPGMEAELAGCAILQCFAPIVAGVEPKVADEVRRLASVLNTRSPLGAFVLLEPERIAAFRHTLLLPPDPAAAVALVTQATWLISYLLSVFGGAIAAAASGSSSGDALAATPFADVFG